METIMVFLHSRKHYLKNTPYFSKTNYHIISRQKVALPPPEFTLTMFVTITS